MITNEPGIKDAYEKLRNTVRRHESMMIAFSGGVDSGVLAYVASDVLRDRALAVIGVSASLAEREKKAAISFLEDHQIPFRTVDTREMDRTGYRQNHPDRCFFCKAELFERLERLAGELGFERIAYGANLDDQKDHRPGAIAAEEQSVVAPLAEAGLGKAAIRKLARQLGLELWDKPASPCLASRIPYYHEVTPEKLSQIEQAEYVLKDRGFSICRVRHYEATARIEVPVGDQPRLRDSALWDEIVDALAAIGFKEVTLETEGFRSGRLNDLLGKSDQAG